jgi:hypothetical protein
MTACMNISTETGKVSATPVSVATTPFISKTKGTHANFTCSMRCSIGHNHKPVSVHSGLLRIRRVALISDRAEGVSRGYFPEDKEGSAVDDSGELMIRLPENRQQ